jgi:adenylate cyclase
MTGSMPCLACGAEPRADARFCDACGSALSAVGAPAEFKQVTVLFADVVHSMDIAAAVGAERLREIMTDLFRRSSAVVTRFGGTVNQFTGDGVMAVFGAPVALEDHALRACHAALEIQGEADRLSVEVEGRDGIMLRLRIGLNSGEVIAGEMGSGPGSYTTIGEQVGMAQRMESVAPPGGVMLSESTARLVEGASALGEPESVRIKGAESPVIAYRLLTIATRGVHRARQLSTLVGRDWELSTVASMIDQSMNGKGRIAGLVGPPGIGKSRLVEEAVAIAQDRGIQVYTTYCESHTSEISFHVVARLLRHVFAIDEVAGGEARAMVGARLPGAEADDLLLLHDLLGIREADVPLPDIDPDARRRRLSALLNTAAGARTTATVYVIEDAHWIDEVSESMIAELSAVVARTHSLLLVTYRPEYHGALDRLPSSHRIALAPLDDSESRALAAELLGEDTSVAALFDQIAGRAAGNPFFAEEIVRDLAERGVVEGTVGAYVCLSSSTDVRVPASLQATIAARIDRLAMTSKRTLNAAAVIGFRFEAGLLASLVDTVEVDELLQAELIDQVVFTSPSAFVFRHPLIRTVAYESQLRSDRARLHQSLADTIKGADAADDNAALVAEHLEEAGDLEAAYGWHMRAGEFARSRDIRAARTSWQRARQVADSLPDDEPHRTSMRILPRTLLCANAWRDWGSSVDSAYAELSELCLGAGDDASRAIGLAGLIQACIFQDRLAEAARISSDLVVLLDTINDPMLTLGLLAAASNAKLQGGEPAEGLRLAQRIIDLAEGDPTRGNALIGSPLTVAITFRAANRLCLGIQGWRADFDDAIAMGRPIDDTSYTTAVMYKYAFSIHNGAACSDAVAIRESAEAVTLSEQSSDDFALGAAQLTRGLVLVNQPGPLHAEGLDWLERYRQTALRQRASVHWARFSSTEQVREKSALGDVDGAIELARSNVDCLFDSGDMMSRGPAVTVLVEALLRRGTELDLAEAKSAVDRLAAVPTDPGFVLHELPLLRMRALLARAHGDEAGYRDFADRYRDMANDLGFEGHMAIAAAMP